MSQAGNMIDPANNNAPLEFNVNKNKPTFTIADQKEESSSANYEGQSSSTNQSEGRSKSRGWSRRGGRGRFRDRDRAVTNERKDDDMLLTNEGNTVEQPYQSFNSMLSAPMGNNNISGLMPQPDLSQWNVMNAFNMMGLVPDSNMLNMMGMCGFGQFGFMGTPDMNMMNSGMMVPGAPIKEIIRHKSCVLYPPKANAPPPSTRERPPGCRTVFVGGLPENATEEVIREVFEPCGPISKIRMSKKNFCHIRFENEVFVDAAIFLSGYRMKLEDKDDAPNTGRLHVDFAQARDDQYEWECQQRAIQREYRHRERMEQEMFCPPSPPPVVNYSDHEASLLHEQLRGDESFQNSVQVLITWLERGECNKRNCGQFYSMIQSTNSHVRRLTNEKMQYEEELNKARQLLKQRIQAIIIQFNLIEKVFTTSSHQKVRDHFTKAQRKNIDMWHKQAVEIKNAQLEEVLNERKEDEMDVSDEEGGDQPAVKKIRVEQGEGFHISYDVTNQLVNNLKEENDALRCQLEAYKNEVEVLKAEGKQDQDMREKQLKVIQQAMQGMQQQLLAVTQQKKKDEEEILKLRKMVKKIEIAKKSDVTEKDENEAGEEERVKVDVSDQQKPDEECEVEGALQTEISSSSEPTLEVTEKDARLIGKFT
ncbi:ecto-NOX disulfide-thiol exchanger 2-like [Limulus polyphemus]|uniref:Ecto-NOX disulfide-thiol exchanger 2-like n=1 Tax=Limulus polyphemus TaxID=6850 RepID=A0ABM1SYR4_LIMPO|nr:ecto-NOX disulfide-thiol exchanger 2-like [Limulus polyphemus]XP_022248770.1 ecto-NOX disulfide-thiol exchanger 2-like [Limulus polyphemus]XP_022248777.1 ecto-NOX disulfide-thiol exchanger 2-like [Limulus polyphemus]XP_022248783.1 ecto-NOX disulfide-thiol exchanger 2-like [Limulus polyphemus]XP_022248787.1 ecto-NOX disulfide-thiol exchanger 2-like [Limulus polyphemus]XP_022248794.1 ecto-NOX disulfide-thiol exchanger 2-like [Limulus polyphemus]